MLSTHRLKVGEAILWVSLYFGIILFYTFLDVVIWRSITPEYSNWLNLLSITICVTAFLWLLYRKGFRERILSSITVKGVLLAICCSALFFLLLDNFLDPIFESLFPLSEQAYQEAIETLIKSPITSLVQVCIIAPIIEEILMRGFVLGGLKSAYGTSTALLLSAILFAILHFNMVQTLSAFVCGIVLGLLYLKTNSIACCIIAHCGYNLISYFTMIYPYLGK